MAKDDAAGPGRAGQTGAAGVLGALAGAALAAHRGPRAVVLGALGGAAGLAAVDDGGPGPAAAGRDPGAVVADHRQRGGGGAAGLGRGPLGRGRAGAGGHGGGRGRRGARAAAAEGAAGAGGGGGGRRGAGGAAAGWLGGTGTGGTGLGGTGGSGGGGGRGGGGRVPDGVGGAVPRSAAEPARRAGPAGGCSVRGSAGQPDPVRRDRVRPLAGPGAGRHVYARRRGHRDRGVTGHAGRAVLRPGRDRSAGPRVLRAHHQVRAGHRAGVAAVGAARATCSTGRCWPGRSGRPACR